MAKKKKAVKKKATKKTAKKKTVKKAKKTKRVKKPNGTCFVLMPFKSPFEMYYRSILKPAVEKANLVPLRGDSLFRPSPIMADIWEMTKEARVLLAELTTRNTNVFYELGLAHAIGKPVVLIAETKDDVPFDLQQLRVILYDRLNPEWGVKLQNDITAALTETLSEPVKSVPPMFRKKVESQAPDDLDLAARVAELETIVGELDHRNDLEKYLDRTLGQNR